MKTLVNQGSAVAVDSGWERLQHLEVAPDKVTFKTVPIRITCAGLPVGPLDGEMQGTDPKCVNTDLSEMS